MDNQKDFVTALVAALDMFGKPVPSDGVIKMWIIAMDNAGITGMQAANALIQHSSNPDTKFPPIPADVVRIVKGGTTAELESKAAAAYGFANQNVAYSRNVVFDDPNINGAIVNYGGWMAFCLEEDTPDGVRRAQFVKAYIAAARGEVREYTLPLMGSDRENWSGVKFIGDREKCKQLLLESIESEKKRIAASKPAVESINVKTLDGDK